MRAIRRRVAIAVACAVQVGIGMPSRVAAQAYICPSMGLITNIVHNGLAYQGTATFMQTDGITCSYSFTAASATDGYGTQGSWIGGTADVSAGDVMAEGETGMVPAFHIEVMDEGTYIEGVDDPWDDGPPPEDWSSGPPTFYGFAPPPISSFVVPSSIRYYSFEPLKEEVV